MDKKVNVSFKINVELKNKAETLFSELGLDMSTAFNMFLRQAVREGRIPFEITINTPNKETISALLESLQLTNDPKVKTYNVDEALEELKK